MPEPAPASTAVRPRVAASESEGEDEDEDEDDEEDDSVDEDEALAAAVQAASLDDSPWTAAPAYSPLYLSTVSEYLPSPPKVKLPAGATADIDDGDKASKGKDGGGWAMEGYENSMDVDHAFERFSKRVSYEGEQCLRYAIPPSLL